MIALVEHKNGTLLTTSKIISDTFNKVHRDVLRSIEKLECSQEFRVRNFAQSYYLSPQNKKLKCYDITRDGFAFLCMGFTGKKAALWKEKYIDAFNSMESSLLNVDLRMNQITLSNRKIKEAGSDWSALGRDIKNAYKENKRLSDELIKDVQTELDLK